LKGRAEASLDHPEEGSVVQSLDTTAESDQGRPDRPLATFLVGLALSPGLARAIMLVIAPETIPASLLNWVLLSEYTVLVIILIRARRGLASLHIDRPSLALLGLAGLILALLSPTTIAGALQAIAFLALGLCLLWLARGYHAPSGGSRLPTVSLLIIGASAGLAMAVFFSVVRVWGMRDLETGDVPTLNQALRFIASAIPLQFARAASLEEALYRGVLWAWLKQRGVKEKWVLILQVVPFWIGHIAGQNQPFAFWVVIPAGGLLLGCLAWRLRSVSAPMIAHTIYNTFAYFAHLLVVCLYR